MIKNNFRQIVGITLLALRASLRTRVMMFLVLLQVLCVLILPQVVKGDGTAVGDLQILLTYTLGFSFGIQSLATLWCSCSLFASEVSSSRIQLSVVKPVRFATFWLGKWLAMLVLNAALLIVVYAIVYAQVRWVEHSAEWPAGVVPGSSHVVHPILPTPEHEAQQLYLKRKNEGRLPKDLSEKTILAALREQARERYDIINPGDQVKLSFHLVRPVRSGEMITTRLNFDTEFSTRRQVNVTCRLMQKDHPDLFVEKTLKGVTQNEINLDFAANNFLIQGENTKAPRDFDLWFIYSSEDSKASAVLLRLRQDAVLLIPGGPFETNLIRAALVQGCVLAVLAAFGLSLSAVFSFSVAAFAATVVLALLMIGRGVLPLISKEDEKQWQNRVGVIVLRSVQYTTKHSSEISPLHSVARGERINDRKLLIAVLWNMGLLPLCLGLFASAVLRRRELADV